MAHCLRQTHLTTTDAIGPEADARNWQDLPLSKGRMQLILAVDMPGGVMRRAIGPKRTALLQQRIRCTASGCIVTGQRIRPAALGKLALFLAPIFDDRGMAIVSFDAARLVKDPVFLLLLLGEFLDDLPGTCPHGRVFDDRDIFKR